MRKREREQARAIAAEIQDKRDSQQTPDNKNHSNNDADEAAASFLHNKKFQHFAPDLKIFNILIQIVDTYKW